MEEEAGSTDQLGFGDCPAFWSEGKWWQLEEGALVQSVASQRQGSLSASTRGDS